MTTLYPAQIDTPNSLLIAIDGQTLLNSAYFNSMRGAIVAIEQTLGVNPAGVAGSVGARIANLENNQITLGGDLGGSPGQALVIGLQGNPVSSIFPSPGQVLTWTGSAWTPVGGGGTGLFAAGGDLSGSPTFQVVIGIQGKPVSTTVPVNSAVPVWDSSIYDIRQLTQDDILPGFSITGFSGGSVVECGTTVINPAFTASYSSLPASANIINTDNISSPLTLSSPFTSGTVVGSFTHSTVNSSVTFTLTAVKGVTRTATTTITYEARSFGGVGSAGAASATASGSTAVLNGGLGTLADEGLHGSDVGQVYGVFSPTAQSIYLLLPHTASPHTFKDNNGFTFAMNSPTTFSFTNQLGAIISMDLYQSTNVLSTPFSILVAT